MTVVPPVPPTTVPPTPNPTPTAPVPPPVNPGSAPISPPGPAPAPVTPAAPAAPAPDDLGDAGKRAIEAERQAARDALTAQQAAEARAVAAEAELETLRKGPLSDAEKALDEARTTATTEERAKHHGRIIEAELKLAAAGKLADPADAIKLLDVTKFKVKDDGSIDGDMAAAITELVSAKPYLAVGATPTKPGPVNGGPQGDGIPLTREALKSMSAQQIAELDPKLVDAALAAP